MRRLLLAPCLLVPCLLVPCLLVSVMAVPVLAPPAALAQVESREGIELQNQILELRHELDQLRAQGGAAAGGSNLGTYQAPTPVAPPAGGGGEGGGLGPQLLDRVQQLEEQVRQLRGRIDEVNNARQQQFDQLSKRLDDLTFQLQTSGRLPAGAAAPAAAAGGTLGVLTEKPAGQPSAAATAQAHRTPEMILQEGNAALARHDYPAAEAAAKQVLANPKSPRATDAQYLLAQSLAGRKDYPAAAVAYDDSYNRSKTGTHAQESLLGLASALAAIDQKKAACETLAKLHAEFPPPKPGLAEPIARVRRNAGCA
jgi:TolA-binding protein